MCSCSWRPLNVQEEFTDLKLQLILISSILCGFAHLKRAMWRRSLSWTSLSTRRLRIERPWPEWFVLALVSSHCTVPVVLRSLQLICLPRAYFRLDCSPEFDFWWRRLEIWRPTGQDHQRHQRSLFSADLCRLWFDRAYEVDSVKWILN